MVELSEVSYYRYVELRARSLNSRNILHYMVGNATPISQDVISVLLHAGLMTPDTSSNGQHSHIITKEGFQFVLMDVVSQVWHFVVQYLTMLQESEMDLVECLNFLFQLSFTTLGKVRVPLHYPPHSNTTGCRCHRATALSSSAPTCSPSSSPCGSLDSYSREKLAINLSSGQAVGLAAVDIPGFLVVQTTFQVTAYTGLSLPVVYCVYVLMLTLCLDSLLKIALLALFTEMNYRFPSICIGVITRDSVRQAFKYGITAEQIINFLKTHSRSPKGAAQENPIPPDVIDQIKLWELERNRLSFMEGVLYNHFLSSNDFHRLEEYAKDINGLIFSNSQNRVMVVCKSAHEDVRRFWKRQKQEH
ncbi:GTF2H4 [Cordylochernes scorpioides]|uniref:General transcription factor IIH subunit 4 n=1 Tax=Cordylochernes scorpioides TaxID=51811 RepID=A0ABY6L314_9ARAC|nr:GTF2H4 [Cordylochernes scorpioides]